MSDKESNPPSKYRVCVKNHSSNQIARIVSAVNSNKTNNVLFPTNMYVEIDLSTLSKKTKKEAAE